MRTMILTILSAASLVAAQDPLHCSSIELSGPGTFAAWEINEQFDGIHVADLFEKMNETMDQDVYETITTHCPGIVSQLRAEVSISSELQFETCDSKVVSEIQQQKFMNQLEKTLKVFDNSYVQVDGRAATVNENGGIPIDVDVVLNISELILNDQKYSILGRKLFSVAIPPSRNLKDREMDFFNKVSWVRFEQGRKKPVDDKPADDKPADDKPSADDKPPASPKPTPAPTNSASNKQGTIAVMMILSMFYGINF